MRTRYRTPVLAALSLLVVVGVGCSTVKAKAAFKDGNKLYKEENYRKAIAEYEKAVALKPDFAEAHFYLASSHQSLFRPGKEGDENKMHLDKAVEHYEKSLETNKADNPQLQQIRVNTLAALTAIYAEPPQQNYEKALGFAEQLVKDNPNDTKNLYAMANLYEKFGRVNESEQTYEKAAQLNPNDTKACGTLASFYNKSLWDEQGNVFVEGQSKGARRVKFEKAVGTLERCADLDPNDPKGHNTLAMFYWDKAYRDPLLSDATKNEYADKGLVAVDQALKTKPDFWEAIVSKGLLYRVKAQFAKNPADRKKFLDQAQLLQKQALELRKEQQASQAGGAEAAAPDAAAAAATEASK
jgi:tetratricopeptide (TPR) repeat protein